MRKMLVFSAFLMALLFSTTLMAQTSSNGDTLNVGPLNSEGQPLGALNEAIKADTTAEGARIHKVYKLVPNAQYILTEVIQPNEAIEIVAPMPTDANRPPIIRCGLLPDGSNVNRWFKVFNELTVKNVWFSGVTLDGTGPIDWIAQEANVSGVTMSYDNVIFEFPYTWWATFADWGGNNNYKFTDCLFMNIGNPTGTTWNGAVMHHARIDTFLATNCTFYNYGAFAVNGGEGTWYAKTDHCTFVNSVVHPHSNHDYVKQIWTNNLWVNGHAFSDDADEISRHLDNEVKGLQNYAEIQWDPQELDSLYGPGKAYGKDYDPNGDGNLTDDELVYELKNNNYFYTQPIKDYWAAWADETVVPNPWMNNYNKAMFENQSGPWSWEVWRYERDTNDVIIDSSLVTLNHNPFMYFVEENTTNLDPGLANINGTDALLAQNCDNIRTEWAGGTPEPVKWHGIDDYLAFTWPITFDLSYSNATLQSAGQGGFPLGDLNWFPEKKAEWLDWLTDVEEITPSEIMPEAYSLKQNYPNPFNPATVIEFSIPAKNDVQLDVYNALGQKVATLVNQEMTAGSYKVDFDASTLSSGVYFYRIQAGNSYIQTMKMLLLK